MNGRKSVRIQLGLCAVAIFAAAALPALTFKVEMSHRDGVYAAGERVPLVVTAVETNGEKTACGEVCYSIDNFGAEKSAEGVIDLSRQNPFTVIALRGTPGIARLRLKARETKEFVWGVAFSPERIRTGSVRPPDFDDFWAEAK